LLYEIVRLRFLHANLYSGFLPLALKGCVYTLLVTLIVYIYTKAIRFEFIPSCVAKCFGVVY